MAILQGPFRKPFTGNHLASYPAADPGVKKSAVLAALRRRENAWELLFTRRSDRLADHRGQIAFPGGVAEESDTGPLETALREAHEEVGIRPHTVRPLGVLDPVDTSSGFRIWPVVGILGSPEEPKAESAEVTEVFWIPIPWLQAEGRWEWQTVPAGKNRGQREAIFFEAYQGRQIWGATAIILVRLLDSMQEGGTA